MTAIAAAGALAVLILTFVAVYRLLDNSARREAWKKIAAARRELWELRCEPGHCPSCRSTAHRS